MNSHSINNIHIVHMFKYTHAHTHEISHQEQPVDLKSRFRDLTVENG